MKAIGVGIAAIAIITSPVAAAADAGDDYIHTLTSVYGFEIPNQATATYWLEKGYSVCTDLMSGASPQAEAEAAYRILPYITEKQAGNLVSAAQMALCPETWRH